MNGPVSVKNAADIKVVLGCLQRKRRTGTEASYSLGEKDGIFRSKRRGSGVSLEELKSFPTEQNIYKEYCLRASKTSMKMLCTSGGTAELHK